MVAEGLDNIGDLSAGDGVLFCFKDFFCGAWRGDDDGVDAADFERHDWSMNSGKTG